MKPAEVTNLFDDDLVTPDPPPVAETPEPVEPQVEETPALQDPHEFREEREAIVKAQETAAEDAGTKESTPAAEPEHVPLATHIEMRNEARAQRDKNHELERRLDVVMDLMSRQQQPGAETPEAEKPPSNDIDPEEDLVGYLRRENEILTGKVDGLAQQVNGTQQVADGQAQENAFMAQLGGIETQFRNQTPDYDQSVEFIRNQERPRLAFHLKTLVNSGRVAQMDEAAQAAAVETQMRRNELVAAYSYHQGGVNPAQAMYDYARAIGYTHAEAKAQAQEESPEAKRLREKAEQQADTQTLGAGGAESIRNAITDGSYDEFEAALRGRGFSR